MISRPLPLLARFLSTRFSYGSYIVYHSTSRESVMWRHADNRKNRTMEFVGVQLCGLLGLSAD